MIYQTLAGTGFEMRRKIFPALVFLPVLWYAGIRQKTTGVDTMAEQEMLLDTATIKAAVAGEKWAKQKVIEHYTPMIDEMAVDEDMKNCHTSRWNRNKKERRTQRPCSPRARCFAYWNMAYFSGIIKEKIT